MRGRGHGTGLGQGCVLWKSPHQKTELLQQASSFAVLVAMQPASLPTARRTPSPVTTLASLKACPLHMPGEQPLFCSSPPPYFPCPGTSLCDLKGHSKQPCSTARPFVCAAQIQKRPAFHVPPW